jgi:hypothetical protein
MGKRDLTFLRSLFIKWLLQNFKISYICVCILLNCYAKEGMPLFRAGKYFGNLKTRRKERSNKLCPTRLLDPFVGSVIAVAA